MSRTMRIVLTGLLTTGALVTGGVALAAGPDVPTPEGTSGALASMVSGKPTRTPPCFST